MKCSTVSWRLQCRRVTASVDVTLDIWSYQTKLAMELLLIAFDKYLIIWVQNYNKKNFILFYCFVFILGKYREIDDEGERKTCMAACDDQSFTVTSSSNAFPGEEDFNHRETFCIIVRWVKLSCLLIDFPRIILQKIVTDHL